MKTEFAIEELAGVPEILPSGPRCHVTSNMTLSLGWLPQRARGGPLHVLLQQRKQTDWPGEQTVYNPTVSWSSGLALDRQNRDVWGEAGGSLREIWMASTWPPAKAGPVTFPQTYSIHSSVLEPQGFQSHLRRGFCWVISWARILPGNLGWWRTRGDFTLRGNAASFGYWGHDVCIMSPYFPYYWMIGVLFLAPWKMVSNFQTECGCLLLCGGMHVCILRV